MYAPSTWTVAGRLMEPHPPRPAHTSAPRAAARAEAPVTIRRARPADAPALAALAALDSARPIGPDALVAEVDGTPVAALDLTGDRAIADPLTPTGAAVDLLRLRAAQLAAASATPRRIRRRRPVRAALAGLLR